MNERTEIEYFISSWKLVPATGGVFDVSVNGELVFSKQAVGRHAEPGEVRAGIMKVMENCPPGPDFVLASK